MPDVLLIDRQINTNFMRIIAWFSEYLVCLTGTQSMDLGMLLKFASLVAWVAFELENNKVSFVFRWWKDFTVWSTLRLVHLVKTVRSSHLQGYLFLSHLQNQGKFCGKFNFIGVAMLRVD